MDALAQLAQAAQLDLGELAEGLDDRRVELLAGHPLQLGDGGLVRARPPVGAVGGDGVVGVHHGEDAGAQGDRLARRCRADSPAPSHRSWWL